MSQSSSGCRWWLSSTAKSPSGKWPAQRLRGGKRCLRVAGQQLAWHLPAAAARQADQVAARLVQGGLHQRALEDGKLLLPRQVAARGEPRQRRVAGAVAGQQDQVVARHRAGVELAGPAAAGLLAAQRVVQLPPPARQAQRALVGGDRQLQPHDGRHRGEAGVPGSLGARLGRGLPEPNGGVQAGMVGDGQRRHAQHGRPPDQLLRMAGTVQEAEVRVGVELAVLVGHREPTE